MARGMKTFVATFWRGNPQLKSGGYITTREIEARTLQSAERKAKKEYGNPSYGWMDLQKIEEKREEI